MNIREKAYKLYQMQWMASHGYGITDISEMASEWEKEKREEGLDCDFKSYLEERGFGSEIWACFEEFIGAEYRDTFYMMRLFPGEGSADFEAYLEDISSMEIEAQNGIHYYEMDFNGYEEGDIDGAYAYCIKTEIPDLKEDDALVILPGDKPCDKLTRLAEIPASEAESCFDMEGLDVKVTYPFGVSYSRQIPKRDDMVMLLTEQSHADGNNEVMEFGVTRKWLKKYLAEESVDAFLSEYTSDDSLQAYSMAVLQNEIIYEKNAKGCRAGSDLTDAFQHAVENQEDELDFYMRLLEKGISVRYVERYVSADAANHMREFCMEHGLL